MKASMIKLLGTLAAGLFALLAAPASAQLSTTANGPYYATPSWDQKLTTNRFVILANWNGEAVLDRETGLVWERSPPAYAADSLHWYNAHRRCNNLSVGGRKGWRLPALQELASLVDPTVPSPGPTLPANHPFVNVNSFLYWSATTGTSHDFALVVRFNDGIVEEQPKNAPVYVWCVRGGQGPDAQ